MSFSFFWVKRIIDEKKVDGGGVKEWCKCKEIFTVEKLSHRKNIVNVKDLTSTSG
jgi:hypothetical protein